MLPVSLNPMTSRVIAPKLGQSRLAGVRRAFSEPLVIAVTGGPGSGKGSQCSNLVTFLNDKQILHPVKARLPRKAYHVNVGQLLRNEVVVNPHMKLPSGVTLSAAMSSGKVLPSCISVPLIQRELARIADEVATLPTPGPCEAPYPPVILLDGFPRTIENLDYFEARVAKIAGMINLGIDPETMIQRVDGRALAAPRRDDNVVVDRVMTHLALFEELRTRFNFVSYENIMQPADTFTTATLRSMPMAVEIWGDRAEETVQEEFREVLSAMTNQWYL